MHRHLIADAVGRLVCSSLLVLFLAVTLAPAPAWAVCNTTLTGDAEIVPVTGGDALQIGNQNIGSYSLDGVECDVELLRAELGITLLGEGNLSVSGGASLGLTSDLLLGQRGDATATISSGAQVDVGGNCRMADIGGSELPGGDALLVVTGEGTRLDCGGLLRVGYDGRGVLEVSDGAVVTADKFYSAYEGAYDNEIRVSSGGRLEITGSQSPGHVFGVRAGGLIDIDGGTMAFTYSASWLFLCTGIEGACDVEVRVANGGVLSVTRDIYVDPGVVITLDGGTIDPWAALDHDEASLLQGSGDVDGIVLMGGDLMPGLQTGSPEDAIGAIHIVGDGPNGPNKLEHYGVGLIELEIASASTFDTVTAVGGLTIGGLLNLVFVEGYEPPLGSRFEVMTSPAEIELDPLNLSVTGLPQALLDQTDVVVEGNAVVVRVPEPTGAQGTAAALCVLGLVSMRWRHRAAA